MKTPTHNDDQSIQIRVTTQYVAEHSDPEADRFVFAYTIRIRNSGQVDTQLLSRHWIITDANGKVEEVRGQGVVGKQPYLRPGEEFEYTSGAVIETPVGTMQGAYQMVTGSGDSFDAEIPVFRLSVPQVLH